MKVQSNYNLYQNNYNSYQNNKKQSINFDAVFFKSDPLCYPLKLKLEKNLKAGNFLFYAEGGDQGILGRIPPAMKDKINELLSIKYYVNAFLEQSEIDFHITPIKNLIRKEIEKISREAKKAKTPLNNQDLLKLRYELEEKHNLYGAVERILTGKQNEIPTTILTEMQVMYENNPEQISTIANKFNEYLAA